LKKQLHWSQISQIILKCKEIVQSLKPFLLILLIISLTSFAPLLIMLNAIIDERKDWYEPEELEDKFGKALEWLYENPDYNDPIMFPWSINEETYIWHTDEGIYVDTCNNHRWYNYLDFDYADEYHDCYEVSFLNLASDYLISKKDYRKQRYGV